MRVSLLSITLSQNQDPFLYILVKLINQSNTFESHLTFLFTEHKIILNYVRILVQGN